MTRAYNPTFSRNKRGFSRQRHEAVNHDAANQFFHDLTGREPGDPTIKPILTRTGMHSSMVAGIDVRELETLLLEDTTS